MITVYTKPRCSQCTNVKKALIRENIPFVERSIDGEILEFAKKRGFKAAPIVTVENRPSLAFSGMDKEKLQTIIDECGA